MTLQCVVLDNVQSKLIHEEEYFHNSLTKYIMYLLDIVMKAICCCYKVIVMKHMTFEVNATLAEHSFPK